MKDLESLKEDLAENEEILAECIAEKDSKGVETQNRILRMISSQINNDGGMDYDALCEVQGLSRYC